MAGETQAPVPEPISYDDIHAYFRHRLDHTDSQGGLREDNTRRGLGAVGGTSYDTELYGPLFIDYIYDKIGADRRALEREEAKITLGTIQQERTTQPDAYSRLRSTARTLVAQQFSGEPEFVAARQAFNALNEQGSDAADVVSEVIIAMGWLYRQRRQEAKQPKRESA